MSRYHWVVQENVRDEKHYDRFIESLRNRKIEYSTVKVIPFSHECVPDVNPVGPVIVWGSTTLDMVAKDKCWSPGTFLNENHDQRIWTERYGKDHMLNGDAEFFEFGAVPAFDGIRFIRPVEDMKIFAGTLVHGFELAEWQCQVLALADSFSTLTPKTVVSISSVKDILCEARFFVVNGTVVTGSTYRVGGLSHHERCTAEFEDWRFAQSMVNIWTPAFAFVMDVAIVGDDCKVIEINCINSCGFYDADMDAVVAAIESLGQ